MLNCPKGGCRSSRHTQNLPLHLNAAIFELIHAFDHILLPHNFMMISQMVQQLSCWETDIHTHKQIPLKVIPPLHAITVSVVKIHRQKPSQHRTLDDMFHLSSWYINYCTHSLLSHQSLTNFWQIHTQSQTFLGLGHALTKMPMYRGKGKVQKGYIPKAWHSVISSIDICICLVKVTIRVNGRR